MAGSVSGLVDSLNDIVIRPASEIYLRKKLLTQRVLRQPVRHPISTVTGCRRWVPVDCRFCKGQVHDKTEFPVAPVPFGV